MILSLGVYGFMMGSLYLLATKAKYSKVRFLYYWISVLIFTVFCAIRYNVGVDYLSYLNEYNYVLLGSGFSRDFEPAFEAITKVLASSGCHFSIYFGIWSLLQIGILYYAMKNEKNIIPFLCFTLFCSGIFFMWMNGIRQSIAFFTANGVSSIKSPLDSLTTSRFALVLVAITYNPDNEYSKILVEGWLS